MTVKDDMAMVFVELFQEDRVKSEDHVGLYLFIVPMSLVLACTALEISKDVRGFDSRSQNPKTPMGCQFRLGSSIFGISGPKTTTSFGGFDCGGETARDEKHRTKACNKVDG